MLDLMKIVGLSAVLSAGFVTASEMQGPPAPQTAGEKIYTDRIPQGEAVPAGTLRISYAAKSGDSSAVQTARDSKGNLLRKTPQKDCAAQAWPHIAPECVGTDGNPPRSVRMITVEQREGTSTSVLVRIPASDIALR